jgi:hypothetical protein
MIGGMRRETVKTRLRVAIRSLIVDEYSLFIPWAGDRGVSEVAFCSQLARHLAPTLPKTWDVDVEYNRALENEVKRDPSDQVRRADLVVHRRTGRGPANNLLIIEMKTAEVRSGDERGGTEISLQGLMRKYEYQHGVFLRLVDLYPEWKWFGGGEKDDDDFRPVFGTATLEVVLAEAETYWQVRQTLTGGQ